MLKKWSIVNYLRVGTTIPNYALLDVVVSPATVVVSATVVAKAAEVEPAAESFHNPGLLGQHVFEGVKVVANINMMNSRQQILNLETRSSLISEIKYKIQLQ